MKASPQPTQTYNVHVTQHAYERIKQRLGTNDKKIHKLALKALRSKHEIPKLKRVTYNTSFIKPNRFCRELMGYVFVFKQSANGIYLVTVF